MPRRGCTITPGIRPLFCGQRLLGRLRALAALGLAASIAGTPACARRPSSRPNLVLLSIDTLRADHLGCYGYGRGTSPNIDLLAARSTLYEKAFAPTPWTFPSHAAMLTGIHPLRLGLLGQDYVIPGTAPFLAVDLKNGGYRTAAFVDSLPNGFLGAERGFDHGFETFKHAPFEPGGRYAYDAPATMRAADGWLSQRDVTKPFFLFLHTKSVHATRFEDLQALDAPYHKPRSYRRRFLPDGGLRFGWNRGDKIRGVLFLRDINGRIADGRAPQPALSPEQTQELIGLYDTGIYYVDEQIKVLLEMLRRHGVGEDTVLILTSDHGEAFLEHRFLLHREVHEPTLRVPLMVYDPREPRARRVSSTVHLEDIPATLLALAGATSAKAREGVVLPRQNPSTAVSRESFSFFRFPGEGYEAYGLSDGRFKLVRDKVLDGPFVDRLYDLARDPQEREPLAAEGSRAQSMLAHLKTLRQHEGRAERVTLDRKTREELGALGYLR